LAERAVPRREVATLLRRAHVSHGENRREPVDGLATDHLRLQERAVRLLHLPGGLLQAPRRDAACGHPAAVPPRRAQRASLRERAELVPPAEPEYALVRS